VRGPFTAGGCAGDVCTCCVARVALVIPKAASCDAMVATAAEHLSAEWHTSTVVAPARATFIEMCMPMFPSPPVMSTTFRAGGFKWT